MEEWKPVPGYESLYKVSSLGRIYSFDRTLPAKNGSTMVRRAKFLVACKRLGYVAITLVDLNGIRKQKLIHRLVAETFIPNPSGKPQVNHINGNKRDNRIENLEWVTAGENLSHAIRLGLKILPDNTGRFNNHSSCKVLQMDKNGHPINEYPSMAEAARRLGVSGVSGFTQACKGKIKTYKGFKWKYITNPRIDKEIKKLG